MVSRLYFVAGARFFPSILVSFLLFPAFLLFSTVKVSSSAQTSLQFPDRERERERERERGGREETVLVV